MLNGLAESTPEEYKQFIDSQMKEMNEHVEKERKIEEEKLAVESQPHFCFSMKAAKIIAEEERVKMHSSSSGDVKLFDFNEKDMI